MRMQRIIDLVAYLAVRTVVCIIQASRLETCAWWSGVLARLAYDGLRLRRQVVDDNLRHAFPQWSAARRAEVAWSMWRHLFLMVCEIALAPRKIHETNWRDYITLRGSQPMLEALLARRPAVLVSGHFGNFEMAGFVAGLLGCPTFAIARPLDNRYLHEFVTRFRSSTGQYMLPKEGSAPQIQAVLESGGALALLADQHAGPKGCWVDFFGRPASCHKALALFSLSNDAPMLVCYARRREKPLQFEVGLAEMFDPAASDEEMLGVKPVTQWYSEVLEREVRLSPEQYWWVHRRWREPPPARRRKKSPPRENPPAAA